MDDRNSTHAGIFTALLRANGRIRYRVRINIHVSVIRGATQSAAIMVVNTT